MIGKKYPAPTICALLAVISFLMGTIVLGGSEYLSDINKKLAGLDTMGTSITRIDTKVADMERRQDHYENAIERLAQTVMEQKRGR